MTITENATITLSRVLNTLDLSIDAILRGQKPEATHAAAMAVVARTTTLLKEHGIDSEMNVYVELLNEALNEWAEFGPIKEA